MPLGYPLSHSDQALMSASLANLGPIALNPWPLGPSIAARFESTYAAARRRLLKI